MIPEKDWQIVSHLRQDARQTLTEMSKKTKIPISTIYDRLKQFQSDLITKHTSLIDFAKIGFTARAQIIIKVAKEEREALKEYLVKHMNINNVYKINNNFDFMAEAVFRHIKDLEDFLDDMEDKFKIKTKMVFYIIEDVKRESFLSEPELLEMVTCEK